MPRMHRDAARAKQIPRQALPGRAHHLRAPACTDMPKRPGRAGSAGQEPRAAGRSSDPRGRAASTPCVISAGEGARSSPAVFGLGTGLIISSAPSPAARHAAHRAPPLIFYLASRG